MKNDDSLPQSAAPEKADSRRQFLQNAGVVAGALVLTRAVPVKAEDAVPNAAPKDATPAANPTILRFADHKELEAVGGSEIIEVGGEKVIVAHTETGFVACSAICTHKGCTVAYKAEEKRFACPCHGARFDESGKVVKGPARVDLKAYDIANALVVAS